MLPNKRAGEPLLAEKAGKLPKLTGATAEERMNSLNDSQCTHKVKIIWVKPEVQQIEFHVRSGDVEAVRQFLDNKTINPREAGELLWTAVDEFQEEIAEMLVRYGADLSLCKYSDNRSFLHHLLRSYRIEYKAERQKLFRLMLDHAADINACDSEDHSVLHDAIKSDFCPSELVEELLSRGALVTISEREHMDDIYLACKNKLEMVPKLIQHQVSNMQARNQRAIIAIKCLISENYTGIRGAAAMHMVKKILDLGVPVNVPKSKFADRRFSFLDTASWYKNKLAIKLLLEHCAYPHQTNILGHTSLYQATAFKGSTHVSRWLIERGVSIHARNYCGAYPIHGACEHESVRNLHLLLNLGADLNVYDRSGHTPFGLMKMREKLKNKEVHHLVIKHFALVIAQGGQVSDKDMAKVNKYNWSREHFEKCTKQLERMKEEKIYGDSSYFSLLSKKMYSTMQLVRNKNFLEIFKRDEKKRAELFPEFFHILFHSFELAQKRLEELLAEKEELREVFPEAIPDHIIEKITYFFFFLMSWPVVNMNISWLFTRI